MDHSLIAVEGKEADLEEVRDANQRANTAGCCGWLHEVAMYVEIALVIGAIVFAILGATGLLAWVYAAIGLVLCVVVAAGIGIGYNRAYIILGTLKALVNDLQGEVNRLGGIIVDLEQTVTTLRGENNRYEQANISHERIVEELRKEVSNQEEISRQLNENLVGYQFALKKYESLVGVFEGKIDATAKELDEQNKKVSEAATDLVALEIRLESCLNIYDRSLTASKVVVHKMELLLSNFTGAVDLDAKNLQEAAKNEQKEEELNLRQEKMLEQQQVLLHQLTEVSNQLAKNTDEYEALNKDFDLTKQELDTFRETIDGQSKVMKRIQEIVQKTLNAFNNPERANPDLKEEVRQLGEKILSLLKV